MPRIWIHKSATHYLAYVQLPFLEYWEVVPRVSFPILNNPVVGQDTPMFTEFSRVQTSAMVFAVGDYETIQALYEAKQDTTPTEAELTDPPNPVKYIMNNRPPRKPRAKSQNPTAKRRKRKPRSPPRLLGVGSPPPEPDYSCPTSSFQSAASTSTSVPSTNTTHTTRELSSNVQLPPRLYLLIAPQQVIPIATLLHINRHSPNVNYFARKLVKLLLPHLFGPDQLRFKYNFYGGGIYGKKALDFEIRSALQWYTVRFFPNCSFCSVISHINEMLRRPESQRQKKLKLN